MARNWVAAAHRGKIEVDPEGKTVSSGVMLKSYVCEILQKVTAMRLLWNDQNERAS